MVKALDLSSNGRIVRVGSNPTPGKLPFGVISDSFSFFSIKNKLCEKFIL